MAHRSNFFNVMNCFITNDQNSNPLEKKASVPKSKSKRNTNVLTSDQIPQTPPKPKHRPQRNTAKLKTSKEMVDLTMEEDDPVQPIHVQILDETLNLSPILIHMKTSSLDNTNPLNPSQCVNSSDAPCIKTEKTSDNDVESRLLEEENKQIDDSVFIDCMSVEQQNNPCKNDVSTLTQPNNISVDLSRDEKKDADCTSYRARELKKVPISKKLRGGLRKGKTPVEEPALCASGKKNSKKRRRIRSERERFHSSKIAYIRESKSYYCFLCEVSIKGKSAVASHTLNDEHPNPEYKCSVCDELFQWKAFLTRHLRQHSGTSALESTIQSDEMKLNSTADISELNKTPEDVDKTSNSLEQLKLNPYSTHLPLINLICDTDLKDIKLTCGYCEQWFPSQVALVEHCRVHMNDKPFICNICGTLFKHNTALIYHTRSHFHRMRGRKKKTSTPYIPYDLKLHSCNHCDRSYTSWSALNHHKLNVHNATPERFVCDVCDRVYYSMAKLNSHKNLNRCQKNQIRYTCEVCLKSYWNKLVLRKHQMKFHASIMLAD